MVNQKPLLILSDAPSSMTGLGRITREFTTRVAGNLADIYRVATLGFGGPGSKNLRWFQYHIEGLNNFVVPNLQEVWEDWSDGEPGVLLSIWDATRLGWLANPEHNQGLRSYPELRSFLLNKPFEKWIYAPIDATGPGGKLDLPQRHTLLGFDRIFTYGQFGADTVVNTIGPDEALKRNLFPVPHGIDQTVFREHNRKTQRFAFLNNTKARSLRGNTDPISKDELLVGIVATNQSRKDWALGIQACGLIAERRKIRLWIHTDALEQNWSIPSLLYEFNMLDRTVYSMGYLSDEKMAKAYSACDVTLGIGAGEGFGYPIFESLFCGTPCIHGNYAGAVEYMDPRDLVDPISFRFEGIHSCKRPVYSPAEWALAIDDASKRRAQPPENLMWNNVWKLWESALRDGVQ